MRYHPTATFGGLFSGIGAAIWTLFEYMMGWHTEHWEIGARTGFIAIVFPIAAIIWALSDLKRSQEGRLSFKDAILCGLHASAVSALIGVVFFQIYYTVINPDFMAAMAARGHVMDVGSQLVAVAAGSIILGLVVSAIAGFFMRTQGATDT
jgi:hypothetical protein